MNSVPTFFYWNSTYGKDGLFIVLLMKDECLKFEVLGTMEHRDSTTQVQGLSKTSYQVQ